MHTRELKKMEHWPITYSGMIRNFHPERIHQAVSVAHRPDNEEENTMADPAMGELFPKKDYLMGLYKTQIGVQQITPETSSG
jgi:hypothetical protein